jgi:hypothetical protein
MSQSNAHSANYSRLSHRATSVARLPKKWLRLLHHCAGHDAH